MMERGIIIFLLLAVSVEKAYPEDTAKGQVASVNHNFDHWFNDQVNQHIQWYYNLEFAFNAYASYFNRSDVALPGFSRFFKESSAHMRDEGLNMTRLVNMRGGFYGRIPELSVNHVCEQLVTYLPDVTRVVGRDSRDRPYICRFLGSKSQMKTNKKHARNKWHNGLYGLEDALAAERTVTDKVYRLISLTKKDIHFKHALEHDFLEPERIKSIGDLVRRLRGYSMSQYNLQEYVLDLELGA